MKKAIFAILSMIITLLMIISIKAYRRFNTENTSTTAVTSVQTTEKATNTTETEKAPETAISSKTETQTETETAGVSKTTKSESTTEEIWVPSPTLDEQGEHTTPLINKNRQDGQFYITGYTAEEGFAEGSITASGKPLRTGMCAMNTAQRKELGINYGDSIYIEGLGTYQVYDCGCPYGVIDVWFHANKTAYYATGYYYVYI